MTKSKTSRRNRINVWVAIGAIILIILLIIWLTFADLTGNTDVAAFLSPSENCIDMETLFGISQNGIGMLVWLLWALIGAFEALLAARMSQKRNLVADLVTGVIAGVLGGYFSIHFAGDSPVQRFLISVMGAVFLAAAAMWIMGRLLRRRR